MDGIERLRNISELRLERCGQPEGKKGSGNDFKRLLNEKMNGQQELRFSRHASERMAERGMEVTDGLMDGLNDAVRIAQEKGSRDALVIGGESMFIINVPNRVVVTAVTREEMKENIFTKIDSAVLI